jgi:(p)ppGpp synthase/HD superfamily hydrolase
MKDTPVSSTTLTARFDDALGWAVELHRDQRRKGSNRPYIGHLLGVCSIVLEDDGDEEEAIAALLHDAVEDRPEVVSLDDIRERCGYRVAGIVDACSDTDVIPKPPWRERKEAYLGDLERHPDAWRVSLADKLFNARAILADYLVLGDELWTRFNTGRDEQLWYYRSLATEFRRLQPGRLATELDGLVRELQTTIDRDGGQRTRAANV